MSVVDLVWDTYDEGKNGYLDKEEFKNFAESYINLDNDMKIGQRDVFGAMFRNYDKD